MPRYNRKIQLSSVTLASPPDTMHKGHPLRNQKTHDKLLDFVMPRMETAADGRDNRVTRLVDVDKQLYGWIRLSAEDEKRKRKKDDSGHPYATKQHMPLTMIHLQDRIAYYSGIFAPTNGMFQQTGNPKEQKAGGRLLKLMNQHSQHAGYYKPLMRSILDIHKYQMGGLITEWDTDSGYEVIRRDGETQVNPTIVWEGNRVDHVDLYNSFWPAGIHVTEIDLKAEYFAQVDLTNYHEIQQKGSSGEWLNVDNALNSFTRQEAAVPNHNSRVNFYKFPPDELQLANDSLSSRQGPWSFLTDGGAQDVVTSKAGGLYERMRIWIWLNPYEHNLVVKNPKSSKERNRLELWKLEVLDGRWLVSAEHVTNAHARIPVAFGTLSIDSLNEWQRSTAEVLRPLQDFMSFLLNTHIDGVRENIWGLTFYNQEMIDLSTIPQGEVAARIPVKPSGQDIDLSKAIYQHRGNADTRAALGDFERVFAMVNQLMPNQALPSQIAGIDRAVDRQVAAVVQGGNRPLQMQARLLDETMLRQWRTLMYFNIIQYQNDTKLENETTGEVDSFGGEDLQGVSLQYIIGQGLKALDKQLVAQELQRIIQAVLQSQEATQQMDIVALLDAWSNYMDIEIDLTQFRKQAPEQPTNQGGAPAEGIPTQGAA